MQKESTKNTAPAYVCEPCGATSPEPGTCCGTAMKPVSESKKVDKGGHSCSSC
ncbi:MAG: hypothetical protein ABIO65_03665 [Nitrospiria bacterium]